MPSKLKVVALVIIVIGAGLAGYRWWAQSNDTVAPENELTLYGNVDIRQIELSFNGVERIASLTAQEGDRVQAGQLLGTLETRRMKAGVAVAEARLAAQQQAVAALEAGTRPEEISKARADVEVATAQYRDAEHSLTRARELAAKKLLSPQELDDALATADANRASLKARQASLDLALAGPRKEDIAAARATAKAYEAELDLQEQLLADAELHAPADAIVQSRILEPGDMASTQKPAYTLALTDPLWVRAYANGPDLGKLKPGMSASVLSDSYPDKRYSAWLGYISPTAEFTPKSVQTIDVRTSLVYQLRIFVCNPLDELRLGMPVTITLPLNQAIIAEGDAAKNCGEH